MNKVVKNSMEMLRSTLLRCAPRLCSLQLRYGFVILVPQSRVEWKESARTGRSHGKRVDSSAEGTHSGKKAVGICSATRAGIHAVNAMVTDGLNRDLIEPPQPTVYLHLIHPPAVLALFKC